MRCRFLPHSPHCKVANRGGVLIKKWGRSSAASTAVSIADHIRSLTQPTKEGDCFSTAVITDGNPYGLAGASICCLRNGSIRICLSCLSAAAGWWPPQGRHSSAAPPSSFHRGAGVLHACAVQG